MTLRTAIFGLLFTALTAGATWAGTSGFGADGSLHQQQGLRHAGGRVYVGGGLRGGK